MPLYRYEALDQTGNPVVSYAQDADEQALQSRLASMGYRSVSIEVAQRQLQQSAYGVGATTLTSDSHAPAQATSRLTANERAIARMLHQLHVSFRAGMPLYQAVTTVSVQVHHPALRQALTEIAAGVLAGATLSQMMERYPRIFMPGDIGVIQAAEMAGFLPEALESLALQHEQDDNTRRRLRIWEWFLHSNVGVFFIIISLAFFFTPAIEAGFDAAAGFRAVGQAFLKVSLPLLLLYFGALQLIKRVRHNHAWAYRWHGFLLRLPVVGRINLLRSSAVFTRTLQQLYMAAVSAPTAWDVAAKAIPNRFLAMRFLEGKLVVESTGRISAGMQQVGYLEPADIGMVATGETTGEVPQALRYLADRYEEDTRVALGASVVRGATSFAVWAFLLGAVAMVILVQGMYGNIFRAVDKGFGIGE